MTHEEIVSDFWKMLAANQFVKSTNSVTDKVETFAPAIVDMEATVAINGEFDKYAIDEWLTTYRAQVLEEERDRIKKQVIALSWSVENETPEAIRLLKEFHKLVEHPTN